jgi:hypothetical protein
VTTDRRRRSTVRDGRFPAERMAELGRRGAAKVDRAASGKFTRRAPDPSAPPPVAEPPATPVADPPAPAVQEAPGLLARFLGRGRR